MQTDVVDKLLYADDLAENAKSEEKMQGAVDRMSKACDNFQLTISTKKTEVVHQPAPGKPYSEPTITVNGQTLQVVDKFTYLGSTLSRAVHIDDEVTARTAKTRYRGPEEGKDAKRTYSIEVCIAKMDWPCHKNA